MSTTGSSLSEAPKYQPWLHKFAIFLTFWTFFVVVIGGTVKSHEAGLSIPEPFIFHWIKDWYNRPNLKWEFFHRMIVGVLYIGTLTFVIATHLLEKRASVRRFSIYLFIAVNLQAIIGYLTVALFAHPQTSIPHAALGQSFLAMMAAMATVLSPAWVSNAPSEVEKSEPSLRKLARWNLTAVFVQLMLGAALRHDDHGKALLEGREWVFYSHLVAHILGALAVLHYLAKLILRVFREHRDQPEFMKPAKYLMYLVTLQLLLGMGAAQLKMMYGFDKENAQLYADLPPPARVWTATAHVAVGALILLVSTVLAVRSYRYASPALSNASGNAAKETSQATDATFSGVHA